ncbi:hypothetical protein ACFVVQ_00670 [Paenibacillus chitinolyticus]|uniref:hypothetical protein n=1 Tax=Paenibacillus chitinolyticus TaxID=79263 RepID=UPI0036D9E6C7
MTREKMTCHRLIDLILDFVKNKGDDLHVLTLEKILLFLDVTINNANTETLLIRLDKGRIANQLGESLWELLAANSDGENEIKMPL